MSFIKSPSIEQIQILRFSSIERVRVETFDDFWNFGNYDNFR